MTSRFDDLDFAGFQALARDPSLSLHEKVGFPDSYRAGKEEAILRDVRGKLTQLDATGRQVLDVGTGCSGVARGLIDLCRERSHDLTLIDSAEMLALLPDTPGVTKRAGRFPEDHAAFLADRRGRLDAILVYSVVQYVFREGNVFAFLDACLELLAGGGELLIGDIPNRSMRRRFFRSPAGVRLHQEFTGSDEIPEVPADLLEPGQIDDGALLGLVLRARAAGYHAFLVPQAADLPMANRREDLLIRKP
ncbi:MAG TPA: SAM-dependent methyltransferase [Acidobacteria bacterium]|nr:SAM-dependent methyltransferase [Acidobacteriota bacterium]